MKNENPTLISAENYAKDIVKSINSAKRRVLLIAATFNADDEATELIVSSLIKAAERGVEVSICADVLTYLEPKKIAFSMNISRYKSTRYVKATAVERRLKKVGAEFRWLGHGTQLLAAGRTHSKWLVVDDIAYVGGGINIDHNSLTNVDYMLKFHDKTLADTLENEQKRIIKADKKGAAIRSRKIILDEKSTILFDGGMPFDSIIYKRALSLAKKAKSATLVSQYCPTGRLNCMLKIKNAKLYFNHWRRASFINKILIQFGALTTRQETLYRREKYLHAKFIVFEMADGKKVALAGSHNFMRGSGVMGTREVAIETRDEKIINQLENFRKKHVEAN